MRLEGNRIITKDVTYSLRPLNKDKRMRNVDAAKGTEIVLCDPRLYDVRM